MQYHTCAREEGGKKLEWKHRACASAEKAKHVSSLACLVSGISQFCPVTRMANIYCAYFFIYLLHVTMWCPCVRMCVWSISIASSNISSEWLWVISHSRANFLSKRQSYGLLCVMPFHNKNFIISLPGPSWCGVRLAIRKKWVYKNSVEYFQWLNLISRWTLWQQPSTPPTPNTIPLSCSLHPFLLIFPDVCRKCKYNCGHGRAF